MEDYPYDKGELIVKEMTDLLCLDLVEKGLFTKSVTLMVGYSNHLNIPAAHGTVSFDSETSADKVIVPAVAKLYERIVNPAFSIRRVNLSCNNVIPEEYHQYSFFTDPVLLEKDHKIQEAVIDIRSKWGKNAILKGMNLQEGAMTPTRNHQIGGHKSGV